MIYLLTGKIHSGKTTMLMKFAEGKKNIAGILTPVINNKRNLKFIPNGREYLLEAEIGKESVLTCGKYSFRVSVFDAANIFLREVFNADYQLIIIDEAGFIELENNGFHDSLDFILRNQEKNNGDMLIVVRESLVNRFLEKYKIKDYKIIKDISELYLLP